MKKNLIKIVFLFLSLQTYALERGPFKISIDDKETLVESPEKLLPEGNIIIENMSNNKLLFEVRNENEIIHRISLPSMKSRSLPYQNANKKLNVIVISPPSPTITLINKQ